MLAAGLKPLEPYPGARQPWLCRHECGREVRPTYAHIQQGDGGCSVCAGNVIDLAIVTAAMVKAGLKPLVSYPGAREPWPCLHECGNEVRPRYNDIQRGQGGCRFCAQQHKYDPSQPACVYLIKFDDHPSFPRGVLKIGVAGSRTQRLNRWRQCGWTLLDAFYFDDGQIPGAVEDELLEWFNEDMGLKPCLSSDDVRGMRGHTETVSVADLAKAGVTVADVRKKVKQLIKEQSLQFAATVNRESVVDLGTVLLIPDTPRDVETVVPTP